MTDATFSAAGVTIPKLGLGTYDLYDEACTRAVAEGLRAGYRHVDTAEMYENEAAVGEGIRASGVPREAVFVTTKVWHDHLADGAMQAAADTVNKRIADATGFMPPVVNTSLKPEKKAKKAKGEAEAPAQP